MIFSSTVLICALNNLHTKSAYYCFWLKISLPPYLTLSLLYIHKHTFNTHCSNNVNLICIKWVASALQAIINSTISPNMTFTKTSQKFGQWADSRANTVYGLGFSTEHHLAKVPPPPTHTPFGINHRVSFLFFFSPIPWEDHISTSLLLHFYSFCVESALMRRFFLSLCVYESNVYLCTSVCVRGRVGGGFSFSAVWLSFVMNWGGSQHPHCQNSTHTQNILSFVHIHAHNNQTQQYRRILCVRKAMIKRLITIPDIKDTLSGCQFYTLIYIDLI